ncbi:IS3 family transposase [Streptomyces griseoincarnatus]|uniref:IS3 family transposase n=1 Tax=Streptomyces sp. NPDC057236 TaxID=3346059 RepID=UPI00362E0FAE
MARGDVWAGKGTTGSVADLVAQFGEEVRAKLQGPAGAVSSKEDSLSAPVEHLLRGMASRQRLKLIVHGQSRIKELGTRPDFAIACGGRTIGHVELKQPGILNIACSSFYNWRRTPADKAARQAAGARLTARIRAVHRESDGTYGVPRITAELRDDGERINHERIARMMCSIDRLRIAQVCIR